ncbi:trissin [Scaptodrosophila lebanonensis]|uniref:Trissin n=1 Tax=Drosophila lebanonensis TaxID=7225 RepID=A0A6J2T8F3_DROLE|nr:trissin [Scaptodrosophila lebanonensis]
MHSQMHFHIIVLCLCVMFFLNSNAIPCDSCGKECASACGTKHFRTCCFNYLRKRTDPDAALQLSSNRRLIDFILLQGRALFTQNELRSAEERHRNGTIIDVGLETYYG